MASARVAARVASFYMQAVGAFQRELDENPQDQAGDAWGRLVAEAAAAEPHIQGGQSNIYRCFDANNRPLALKVSKRGWFEVQALTAELKVLRRCKGQKGIVQLMLAGRTQEPSIPYLVMEWCPQALRQKIEQETVDSFPLKSRVEISVKVAEAVVWVHDQLGFAHSDLKSQNILLDAQGEPRLADFGIGFSLIEAERNRCLNDPDRGFLAPERCVNSSLLTATISVDVYGVAVLNLELLSCIEGHPDLENQISVPCSWYNKWQPSVTDPSSGIKKRISVLELGEPGVHPLTFTGQEQHVREIWSLIKRDLHFIVEERSRSVFEQLQTLRTVLARLSC